MANPEKELAEQVLAGSGLSPAKLGLRFDRVVVRVLGDLRAFAEGTVPQGAAVIATISAPIRLPASTIDAIREQIAALQPGGWRGVLHGNQVSLRLVRQAASGRPRLIGFVHNPGTDVGRLLDLAASWLRD